MATDRQIGANRRNARRSTGQRSSAGKNRASHNAYRHGLSVNLASNAEYQKRLASLVRKFAGQSSSPIVLEFARMAAAAQLEQGRFEQAKLAVIQSFMAFSRLKIPRYSPTQFGQVRRMLERNCDLMSIPMPEYLPASEPERLTTAIRWALPQLLPLERYARRAQRRRERALRILCAGRIPGVNL